MVYLTEHMASEEVITLSKFLVLSGVILPLTPREPLSTYLPVSLHETWLAVVVISGISYVSYLAQTYFLRGKGILLTGAIGGLYSSTATTLVIARQSARSEGDSLRYSVAIMLATGMMYLRLLILAFIFDAEIGEILLPPFVSLSAMAFVIAIWVHRSDDARHQGEADNTRNANPLEVEAAAFFALAFLFITGLTHYLLERFPTHGLQDMAILTGLSDIDPFVMAVLSGHLAKSKALLAGAIALAAGSNGVMKGIYVATLGSNATRRWATGFLMLSALVTFLLVNFSQRFSGA